MTAVLQGIISQRDGLKEALEIVMTLKHINSGILEVKSSGASGFIGVAWGRFITGAALESGEVGKPALRTLLKLSAGRFSFYNADEPVSELRQSLGIDIMRLSEYVPNIDPEITPWLYDPNELDEAFLHRSTSAQVQSETTASETSDNHSTNRLWAESASREDDRSVSEELHTLSSERPVAPPQPTMPKIFGIFASPKPPESFAKLVQEANKTNSGDRQLTNSLVSHAETPEFQIELTAISTELANTQRVAITSSEQITVALPESWQEPNRTRNLSAPPLPGSLRMKLQTSTQKEPSGNDAEPIDRKVPGPYGTPIAAEPALQVAIFGQTEVAETQTEVTETHTEVTETHTEVADSYLADSDIYQGLPKRPNFTSVSEARARSRFLETEANLSIETKQIEIAKSEENAMKGFYTHFSFTPNNELVPLPTSPSEEIDSPNNELVPLPTSPSEEIDSPAPSGSSSFFRQTDFALDQHFVLGQPMVLNPTADSIPSSTLNQPPALNQPPTAIQPSTLEQHPDSNQLLSLNQLSAVKQILASNRLSALESHTGDKRVKSAQPAQPTGDVEQNLDEESLVADTIDLQISTALSPVLHAALSESPSGDELETVRDDTLLSADPDGTVNLGKEFQDFGHSPDWSEMRRPSSSVSAQSAISSPSRSEVSSCSRSEPIPQFVPAPSMMISSATSSSQLEAQPNQQPLARIRRSRNPDSDSVGITIMQWLFFLVSCIATVVIGMKYGLVDMLLHLGSH